MPDTHDLERPVCLFCTSSCFPKVATNAGTAWMSATDVRKLTTQARRANLPLMMAFERKRSPLRSIAARQHLVECIEVGLGLWGAPSS